MLIKGLQVQKDKNCGQHPPSIHLLLHGKHLCCTGYDSNPVR